jgi:hypothetical protein
MFEKPRFSHHKQLFECVHPLWIPKYEKIPPMGLVVEVSSEQQTNTPN